MLQQTQVSTVQEAFKKWMTDFPNVLVLSKASEQEVLLHWQGLGYYTRARNILKAAKDIVKKYSGKFPENRGNLESLTGGGAYTAGAILSLAFHQQEPILDGNLVRIFSRLYLWNFLPDGKGNKEKYWEEAEKWCGLGKAFLTNEALMELGRSVCKKSS
ncbi:MAG: A/G-specific adenine glycosylase, partial [Fibrobacteraceae bacterium]|nr:A/G-specific adenine glycosylase [Fibrobacteraceae bacterium]